MAKKEMLRLTIEIKQEDVFYLAARLQEIAKKIENGILKGDGVVGGGRCEFHIMDEAEIQEIARNPVYVGDICPKCRERSEGGVTHANCEKRRSPGDHGLHGVF